MSSDLPRLFLAPHGDTAWPDSRQHTGRTDLPLNERGDERARLLGERLIDHRNYVTKYGDDMPKISGWKWGQPGQAVGRASSTEGDNV